MMKKTLFALSFLMLGMIACNDTTQNNNNHTAKTMATSDNEYSKPIDIDTANRMIQSYLDGIDYTTNTDEIRSLVFNADVLRDYINNTDQGTISKVKFIFAHNLDYINAGHEGERPGPNSNALTMIIVGVDAQGNYVYTADNQAMDFCQPCPKECLDEGTASSDLLVPYTADRTKATP